MNKKKAIQFALVFVSVPVILVIAVPLIYRPYIENRIDKANYCASQDDCGQLDTKCPFGCHVFVNKIDVNKINRLIEFYPGTCTYRCRRLETFKCINNECRPVYADQEVDSEDSEFST